MGHQRKHIYSGSNRVRTGIDMKECKCSCNNCMYLNRHDLCHETGGEK